MSKYLGYFKPKALHLTGYIQPLTSKINLILLSYYLEINMMSHQV